MCRLLDWNGTLLVKLWWSGQIYNIVSDYKGRRNACENTGKETLKKYIFIQILREDLWIYSTVGSLCCGAARGAVLASFPASDARPLVLLMRRIPSITAFTYVCFGDPLEAAPAAWGSQEGYRCPPTLLYSSAKSVPMKRVFTSSTSCNL